MPAKIDPLNKKQRGAISAMLTVKDLKAAADFYKKAFGFAERSIMNGPDGEPMHGELTLRDTQCKDDGRLARDLLSFG
jgi:catechol 2,3-dioxygenase-like lactoylglutathione lyase family enzyme